MEEGSGGYTGRYCVIDLGRRASEVVEPGPAFYRHYLGGYGLGAAVIMDRQAPGIDPLAPESHLGFCSGLLTGSGAYFSGRFMVVGKSPLTGGWGDANAGGAFSLELKRTGYDAIFFTGAAATPVWVLVNENRIDIRDATDLWGLDIPTTEQRIRHILGDPKAQIASIGEAGERLSLIAGISTDKARIAARSGLGAVMGAKNLKAVVLRGRGKVPVADRQRLKAINRAFITDFKKSKLMDRITVRFLNPLSMLIARTGIHIPAQHSMLREVFRRYGTSGLTAYSAMVGDMPIKNWAGVGLKDFPMRRARGSSDQCVIQRQKRRYACQGCPLGCGGIIDIRTGPFAGQTGHKPEYETLGAFGGMLLNDDLDAIIEVNEMCNRAGIDTISAGAVVAFAIECFQHGLIGVRDTGGLVLDWGRPREVVALTDKIIRRQDIGDVLADGVRRAAARIGGGAERFAVHAGGQELPMHDARLDPGFAIAYECEPTPGRHTISCYLYAGLFGVEKRFPMARRMIRGAPRGQARDVRRYAAGSFYMQLLNCSGMCLFGALTSRLPMVEYLNAVTGWQLAPDDYLTAGERILSLRKAFNVREGVRPEDHRVSRRAIGGEPLAAGPLKGVTLDMDALRAEFFQSVGWDPVLGGPTPEKIRALGLETLVSG